MGSREAGTHRRPSRAIEERLRAAGVSARDLIPDYEAAVQRALAFAASWQGQFVEARARTQKQQEAALVSRTIAICSRVYVGSIHLEASRDELIPLFRPFGGIRIVEMSLDPATGRHRGFCFVEYEVPESASGAIAALNGVHFAGRMLKVGRPSNYANDTPNGGLPPADPRRIFVSNVHSGVSESDLAAIFEPFGTIEEHKLCASRTEWTTAGFGYISFSDAATAATAITAMDGFQLAGLPLYVRPSTTSIPISLLLAPPSLVPALLMANPLPETALIHTRQPAPTAARAPESAPTRSLDEDVSISTSTQRIQLIQRLARTEPTLSDASQTVVFTNMATLKEVDAELKEDIVQECGRFDRVSDIHFAPSGPVRTRCVNCVSKPQST